MNLELDDITAKIYMCRTHRVPNPRYRILQYPFFSFMSSYSYLEGSDY